jgi:hypothetical protein
MSLKMFNLVMEKGVLSSEAPENPFFHYEITYLNFFFKKLTASGQASAAAFSLPIP